MFFKIDYIHVLKPLWPQDASDTTFNSFSQRAAGSGEAAAALCPDVSYIICFLEYVVF